MNGQFCLLSKGGIREFEESICIEFQKVRSVTRSVIVHKFIAITFHLYKKKQSLRENNMNPAVRITKCKMTKRIIFIILPTNGDVKLAQEKF